MATDCIPQLILEFHQKMKPWWRASTRNTRVQMAEPSCSKPWTSGWR